MNYEAQVDKAVELARSRAVEARHGYDNDEWRSHYVYAVRNIGDAYDALYGDKANEIMADNLLRVIYDAMPVDQLLNEIATEYADMQT